VSADCTLNPDPPQYSCRNYGIQVIGRGIDASERMLDLLLSNHCFLVVLGSSGPRAKQWDAQSTRLDERIARTTLHCANQLTEVTRIR
jgi:hypothetical protein